MPPPHKRPARAITVVDPNSPQLAMPPAPPLPSKSPPSARTSPGYDLIKSIIENLDPSLLPTPQRTFQAHAAAPPKYKPESSSKKSCSSPMENPSEGDKGKKTSTTQIDPLLYTLTRIFHPHNRENTTCLDRFEALQAATTPQEWDLAHEWKVCAEMNAYTLKTLHAQDGPDAVVSLAMKRWLQRVLGLTLEEIFASQIQHLSAVYHDPMAPPVYHYPEQQIHNTHTGFHCNGMYDGRSNVYHPQRTPQPPLRASPSQDVLPRAPLTQPRNRDTPQHSTNLPAFPRSYNQIPNLDNNMFQRQPSNSPRISETRFLQRSLPYASSPLPNPSGRNTPPHKRLPKKGMANVERTEKGYNLQGENSVVSGLMVNKEREMPDNGEGSSTISQLQDHVTDLPIQASTDGKEKGEVVANQESNQEASSTSDINSTLSQFVANSLPDMKKRVVVKPITASAKAGSSEMATNQSPDRRPPRFHPSGKTFGVAKMLAEKWVTEKQQVDKDRKDQTLNNGEGSSSGLPQVGAKRELAAHGMITEGRSWPTNDRLGGSSSIEDSRPDHSRTDLGVKVLEVPVSVRYGNTRQPLRHKRPLDIRKILDSTVGVGEDTDVSRTLIPIKGPAPVCPSMFPPSPPGHTEAVISIKNMDKLALDRTLPASRIWKPSTVSIAPKIATTTPIQPITSSPLDPLALTGSSAPANSNSPSFDKSRSLIVTGNINGPSLSTDGPQRNTVTAKGFLGSGKPLDTFLSNQLPTAEADLKKKTSLSATAKPFEPAALRYAASMDSYLRSTNYAELPISQHQVPITQQPPVVVPLETIMSTMQTPVGYMNGYMNFSFDYLLETFYDTTQFTQYLNKSYNELLFMENCLRTQYQRISTVFEDEWNYITASQRKAIIAKALTNLSDRVDKVQFNEGKGVETMLCDLGLINPLLDVSPKPVPRRATDSNLREAHTQGVSINGSEEKGESVRSTKVAYLKWRAEHCFDVDPDALSITPDWLFGIIGWLLGMPHPLRHRFGPGRYYKGSDSTAGSNQQTQKPLGELELWCPDDCLECAESEQTGLSAESTFFRRDRRERYSSSGQGPPMLERFLDEMGAPDGCFSEVAIPHPPASQTSTHPRSFILSQPSILRAPRLMSNRFTDPIFHLQNRSDEWKANNPGRVKFMEILNIDMALFYCALIEEILEIFGEVRRERVWFRLPTRADYYDALPGFSSTQSERGRTRARSEREGSGQIRSISVTEYSERLEHKNRRAEVRECVDEERKRVRMFVEETQRSLDWLVSGLKLVDKDSDTEIGRARDGGLWKVPVPPR